MSQITVNSRKYDKSIRRSWQCKLIEENSKYFVFLGEFETEVNHKQLGVIRPSTVSYEYYWKNEYFNVFSFYEPNGEFRNFYCNISMPPTFENGTLDYVDLDIDILVWQDFSIEILDIDEYETNKEKYSYPVSLQQKVSESIEILLSKIKNKEFPFDINL
jgi:uncharacterized protein